MAISTFKDFLAQATQRSKEADMDWGRDPSTSVRIPSGALRLSGGRNSKSYVKKHYQEYKKMENYGGAVNEIPTDGERYSEEKPKPEDWGSW